MAKVILDATAANRTMWRNKNIAEIVFCDIEKKLQRKPTIFCDNRQAPFKNNVFDTVFFDPPFAWNLQTWLYSFPNITLLETKYPNTHNHGRTTSYYGCEKYKNEHELIRYITHAQKELFRILKSDGILWLKWNNMYLSLKKILAFFNLWKVGMVIKVKTSGKAKNPKLQTYWVCLLKNWETKIN